MFRDTPRGKIVISPISFVFNIRSLCARLFIHCNLSRLVSFNFSSFSQMFMDFFSSEFSQPRIYRLQFDIEEWWRKLRPLRDILYLQTVLRRAGSAINENVRLYIRWRWCNNNNTGDPIDSPRKILREHVVHSLFSTRQSSPLCRRCQKAKITNWTVTATAAAAAVYSKEYERVFSCALSGGFFSLYYIWTFFPSRLSDGSSR